VTPPAGRTSGRTEKLQGRPVRLSVLPSVRRAVGWALLAAASVYTAALVTVLVVSQQDERRSVDAIVVLGAAQYNGRPSPVLRARLNHALHLYREGHAPRIIVTGGMGLGDTTSEATVGRHFLVAHGVPPEAVIVQAQGRSTQASMTAVGEWLDHEGLRRVLLVSDPFHMFRLRMEARRTNLEAYTSPTEDSPISDNPVLELQYLFAEGFKIPVAWFRAVVSPLTSHSQSL
jgi:uncharacterized SAM-binding protein YcdF (DUF218 family)